MVGRIRRSAAIAAGGRTKQRQRRKPFSPIHTVLYLYQFLIICKVTQRSLPLPVLQYWRMQHSLQCGDDGRQHVRPCEIKFTCNENRTCKGIPDWTRSMSRGEHDLSGRVGRTHPKRRHIRQQFESTGKTARTSEYIMTHRALFFPTPGSDPRYSSHSASLIARSGESVGAPKSESKRDIISDCTCFLPSKSSKSDGGGYLILSSRSKLAENPKLPRQARVRFPIQYFVRLHTANDE